MFAALVLVSAPAWFCWLLADGAKRGVIRLPSVVVSGANALYLALVAAPFAFVVLLGMLAVRVRLLDGLWPRPGHFDPRTFTEAFDTSQPLDMPIHARVAFTVFFLALGGVVGVPALWPLLRVVRNEPVRKILCVFLPGLAVLVVLWRMDPGGIFAWFLDSMFD